MSNEPRAAVSTRVHWHDVMSAGSSQWPHHVVSQHRPGVHRQCTRMQSTLTAVCSLVARTRQKLCRGWQT